MASNEEKQEEIKNMEPQEAMIYLLLDVSSQLADVKEAIQNASFGYGRGVGGGEDQSHLLRGLTDYFEGTVTRSEETLRPADPGDMWYAVQIQNIGNNNLFFLTNGQSTNSGTPYIEPGDSFTFDPKRKVVEKVILYANPNTETEYRVLASK